MSTESVRKFGTWTFATGVSDAISHLWEFTTFENKTFNITTIEVTIMYILIYCCYKCYCYNSYLEVDKSIQIPTQGLYLYLRVLVNLQVLYISWKLSVFIIYV